MPTWDFAALGRSRPRDYAVRFLFGGIVTVLTGVIAKAYGPSIGGLFLAFPAILPASMTLLKHHDGLRQAVADAGGARLGATALIGFAAAACALTPWHGAALTLAAATGVWAAVAVALWILCYGLSPDRRDS